MLDFGRDITGEIATAESREWLCTNGIGGFASGTLAGSLARRYHGLLVAALAPPLGRTLLAAKLDESVTYARERSQGGHPIADYQLVQAMLAEVEGSLRRLRTDRIDIYMPHFDDGRTPIEEIML